MRSMVEGTLNLRRCVWAFPSVRRCLGIACHLPGPGRIDNCNPSA